MLFVLARSLRTSGWYEEQTPAVFSLPFHLASSPGFEVNRDPEGEPCTNDLLMV